MKASLSHIVTPPVDENAGYPGPTPQDELAADLRQHITESLAKGSPPAERLAGGGEILRVHHDEPSIDPTLAERIRIPFPSPDVAADLYIRECDGTVCVLHNGEHVLTIEDQLSRHGAISAALSEYYRKLIENGTARNKLLAAELNAYIAKTIDDPTKIVPAGESCEWPLADEGPIDEAIADDLLGDEPPVDDTTTAADIPSCAVPTDEFVNLIPLEGGAVDGEGSEANPASAEACGEVGVVEVAAGGNQPVAIVHVDKDGVRTYEWAPGYTYTGTKQEVKERIDDNTLAQARYEQSLAAARVRCVDASQARSDLEEHLASTKEQLKTAKETEADCLAGVAMIKARGWQMFLPAKPKSATASTTTTETGAAPVNAIPSPPSTLPPPQAEAAHAATPDITSPGSVREDWASVSIDEFCLSKSLTARLKDAGCETIGKFEAMRSSPGGLGNIDGIGEVKMNLIEKAAETWLDKNRDHKVFNDVRERNREAMIASEAVALEMAAQGQ